MLSRSLSPTGKSNIWTFHCWFAALWLRGSALLKSWQPDGENSVADFATVQLRCAICCEWECNFYKRSAEQELPAQVMQHTGPFTRVRCGIWVSRFEVNYTGVATQSSKSMSLYIYISLKFFLRIFRFDKKTWINYDRNTFTELIPRCVEHTESFVY